MNHPILLQKSALTVLMVSWYFLLPVTGYDPFPLSATPCIPAAFSPSPTATFLLSHVLYIFSHANIWHLFGNLFVLWIMSSPLYVLPSIVIAVLCSFLPAFGLWTLGLTVGFSGVLFAIAGIKWGRYCYNSRYRRHVFNDFCVKVLPFALIGVFIPHVNWCIHLYSLLLGFLYGRFLYGRFLSRK